MHGAALAEAGPVAKPVATLAARISAPTYYRRAVTKLVTTVSSLVSTPVSTLSAAVSFESASTQGMVRSPVRTERGGAEWFSPSKPQVMRW